MTTFVLALNCLSCFARTIVCWRQTETGCVAGVKKMWFELGLGYASPPARGRLPGTEVTCCRTSTGIALGCCHCISWAGGEPVSGTPFCHNSFNKWISFIGKGKKLFAGRRPARYASLSLVRSIDTVMVIVDSRLLFLFRALLCQKR